MNKLKKLVLVLILLLIPNLTLATDISKASLDKFMAVSGLNEQIDQLPGMVQAGMQQARGNAANVPGGLFDLMERSAASAFEPGWFRVYVANQLKRDVTEADVRANLTWYESTRGQKITAEEVRSSTPEAYQEMFQNAESLLANTEKIAIASKIDQLVHATEMTISLQEKSAIAVYSAMMTALQPGVPVDIDTFKRQIGPQMEQLRAQAETTTLLSFVSTYKTLDQETMEQYILFLESTPARRLNASVEKGLLLAFDASIKNMAKEMATALKN